MMANSKILCGSDYGFGNIRFACVAEWTKRIEISRVHKIHHVYIYDLYNDNAVSVFAFLGASVQKMEKTNDFHVGILKPKFIRMTCCWRHQVDHFTWNGPNSNILSIYLRGCIMIVLYTCTLCQPYTQLAHYHFTCHMYVCCFSEGRINYRQNFVIKNGRERENWKKN